VSADPLVLLPFVIALDGHRGLTLNDALRAALWTACCIVTWRIMWGPRRRH
jgi:hypothetical protein